MKEFDNYVKDFDLNDYDIAYKYHHCYRVCELSDIVANKLNLSDEDKYLAHLIGLLHDIGRFMQLKVYHTFDDQASIDHGDYGADLLFKENLIEKFNVDKKYYRIIEKAIRNHDKLAIEPGLNEQELLHAKIIRDTDKIDIYNAYTDLGAYSITKDLDYVSPIIEENFFKKLLSSKKYRKTKSDELLLKSSLIYDIYFNESLEIIKERNYITKLYNQIDASKKEEYKKYFDFLNKYIEERIENNVRN